MPADIETIYKFRYQMPLPEKGIYPWELELLIKEIIINGTSYLTETYSLKQWRWFSRIINHIKQLEEDISGKYVNQDNILIELYRIANRQFPWQSHSSKTPVTRYYKIFSDPNINRIVHDSVGLSVEDIYIISLAFLGAYLSNPAIKYPVEIDLDPFGKDKVEIFLSRYSLKFQELKNKLVSEEQINEKFAYSYSSLRAFPLISTIYRNQQSIACPLPTLLIWRVTSGLFYDICSRPDFGNYFGRSFQQYVGEVLTKSKINNYMKIYDEQQYFKGRDRKDSVDWIVYDQESKAALFVECKTKRVKVPAKIELVDMSYLDQELEFMSNYIGQIYKTINDHIDNHYTFLKYDRELEIFPLILTLESWHFFGDLFAKKLKDSVVAEFNKNNISLSLLDTMPYSLCSVDEFEILVQVVQQVGISNFMRGKVFDPEKKSWAFKEYTRNQYPEQYNGSKFLFESDYEKIFAKVDRKIN